MSDELNDDEPDLLGVLELAVRGSEVERDEVREDLARVLDRHEALVALRDRALAVAVQGDGRDVSGDDLFDAGDEDDRARVQALFDRATAIPLRQPIGGTHP